MFNQLWKFQRQFIKKKWKRWQLFHATDFLSLMRPCFTICHVLGLFPYKINASIFEASRSRYVVLIIISSITSIYLMTKIYEINVLNVKVKITERIEDNCFLALRSFIVIVSAILSGTRMRLLQTLLEVSSKLPPKSFEKLSKLIHMKDIFGFLLVTVRGLLSFVYYKSPNNNLSIIIRILAHYNNLQIFQMNMLYMNCVCILKACFKRIDDNLINLQELLINNKSRVPRLICHQQRNPFLLEELKTIKKQYLLVSDTVQMLNKIFSPQLLATFIMVFVEITFELYMNTVQWHNGLFINLINQFHETYMLFLVIYYVIKVILIVWACETGKNQAIKISTTVHDFLNIINDEQIKIELQTFSLQIMHRNNTFSAKGLTVDATLLTAMVGTISTYLLILIQFFMTAHSCGKAGIYV
ncbi:uncharacterized protein LOC120359743 isoform X1 [Solenopsis invicta]|uniref:uncharacterized protein LOC120359743 isoform X1 n=1 Tax=Solenopsis invicta TaxID=13686 RepID=UPI00193E57A3|nr:uncharacterized protein LOC120359743 isoform X1 [Solenopsis invicta]